MLVFSEISAGVFVYLRDSSSGGRGEEESLLVPYRYWTSCYPSVLSGPGLSFFQFRPSNNCVVFLYPPVNVVIAKMWRFWSGKSALRQQNLFFVASQRESVFAKITANKIVYTSLRMWVCFLEVMIRNTSHDYIAC